MKKTFTIAGLLVLKFTSTASFADHLEPKKSEIRPSGFLAHTNINGSNLTGAKLRGAKLNILFATNITGCRSLYYKDGFARIIHL